jgi:hypothetical protein
LIRAGLAFSGHQTGEGVRRVLIVVVAGAVKAPRGPRVGVSSGILNVTEAGPGVYELESTSIPQLFKSFGSSTFSQPFG